MNYRYGNKAQWRRWVWNRIAERITQRSDAVVMFLPGKDALDIPIAENNGFRRRNMIAIERDAATVTKLRKMGIATIDGDLREVLRGWPPARPVAAVHADLCCGLEGSVLLALAGATGKNEAFGHTTFAVNLLRGRDASFTPIRAVLNRERGAPEKHRGYLLLGTIVAMAVLGIEDHQEQVNLAVRLHQMFNPKFSSYKSNSSTQYFDSVVFSNPMGDIRVMTELPYESDANVGAPIRRKIAATLAHRTRGTYA